MRISYLRTSAYLASRELLRRRITLTLLLIIPTLFYLVVDYTTGSMPIYFKLKSISEDTLVEGSARDVSLVFIGLASTGLLTSFLGLNLVQKDAVINQRLILCGYRTSELLLSKLAVLMGLITVIAVYVSTLGLLFFEPLRWLPMMLGYILGGFVYGCYGLLIGTLFRRELEGILLIILLANIDAGWLQNPVFYSAAENTVLIEWMPAYFPSQISLAAAFSNDVFFQPLLWSIVYGCLFLLVGMGVYRWRMHVGR